MPITIYGAEVVFDTASRARIAAYCEQQRYAVTFESLRRAPPHVPADPLGA